MTEHRFQRSPGRRRATKDQSDCRASIERPILAGTWGTDMDTQRPQTAIDQTALSVTDEPAAYFVYDGDCPLCTQAARALRIRKAIGRLELVDARNDKDHPVLLEVKAAGLDLDQGMVFKTGGTLYHGADALHMMALLGSGQGWFNRLSAMLFRSKRVAAIAYPPMRATRNVLLALFGADKIGNL